MNKAHAEKLDEFYQSQKYDKYDEEKFDKDYNKLEQAH